MNIKDLKIDEEYNFELNDDNQNNSKRNNDLTKIYQFQSKTDHAYLVHVGVMSHKADSTIGDFKINDDLHCYVVSCLYDNNDLNDTQDNNIFPLIRIFTTSNDEHREHIRYNFHTNVHKGDNIKSFVSYGKDNMIKLDGYYSITSIDHEENKITIIEENLSYDNHQNAIEKCLYYLKKKIMDDY